MSKHAKYIYLILCKLFFSNMTFDYRVSTNYFNHSVSLTVIDCGMESDKNGDCLYDTLTLFDGKRCKT